MEVWKLSYKRIKLISKRKIRNKNMCIQFEENPTYDLDNSIQMSPSKNLNLSIIELTRECYDLWLLSSQ